MKKPKSRTSSQLAKLRARLEEAEQTLEAIRSGSVDALIVGGPGGERVFTLEGADHRYRRIVEGMTEGALIVSREGLVLYSNGRFAEFVRTPIDQVLGSNIERYVPGAASVRVERWLNEVRQRATSFDTELRTADGGSIPVHISAALDQAVLEGGICLIVTDMTGVVRDMRARIEAERALERAESGERQFRELVNNLPELAWNARPDGSIDFFNKRWYEYTGQTPEQSEGWGWQTVHHPDVLPRVLERWHASLASGEPFEMEYPLRRRDGVYRWFLTRVRALRDDDGGILRWFGTNTDIDDARRERQRAEALATALAEAVAARTRALDEAGRVSRAKDEFLATMSHELRTPLNSILGWATILRSGRADATKQAHGIEVIERNARAQERLVSDLLDISRIINGKLRLNVQSTDLALVIAAALDVVRQAADAKGIRLLVEVPNEVGQIVADPDRLQQIVWNLLSNAVKFTPSGGEIRVSALRDASSVRVRVEDSGVGIAAEHIRAIFDRFTQVDGSTTRRHGGLGLGLGIVRHLAEAHGGTVEAHSDGIGKGATFDVTLPVGVSDPNRPTEREDASQGLDTLTPVSGMAEGLHGRRILIVEDDDDSLELLRAVLEGAGAQVTTAGSASEGLEHVKRTALDLIVSDIGMPDMDGYDFMRSVRALAEGKDIPAIALTAYARAEDAAKALQVGYQAHLIKPVNANGLVGAITSLLRLVRPSG